MGLEDRVSALEGDLGKLTELVDGQNEWSHRKRLHKIEDNDRGVEFASKALEAYTQQRDRRGNRVREWGSFALAMVALLLSALNSGPWG